MLDANMKAQLKTLLERINENVELVAFVDDSAKSREVLELIDDIAALSDRVSARRAGNNEGERVPSFSVSRAGTDMGVRFAGLPMGHEFTSLVLALLQAGGYPPKITAEQIEAIKALDAELEFTTYISLSCHNCPDVVQALNLMAILNPKIRHTMVDGGVFRQEVESKNILAVPTMLLNGEEFGSGRMTLEEILAKVDVGASERDAAKLSQKDAFDVLIVGGGPAGAAAAIYAARKGIATGIVSERFGGQVMDTMAIENFISVKETEGPKMVAALEEHVKTYEVDIMNLQRAAKVVPATTPGGLAEVVLENGAVLKSRSVILATGARWRELNVPGEREYRNRGVAYCPHCDGPLFKGKHVAVIGGGNSGVEAAIDLAGIVGKVTLIEFDSKLRADAVLQAKLTSLPNVTVITSAQTTEVTGDGNRVNGLVYVDRVSGETKKVELEGVFVQIGLLPNTDFLKGSVELSRYGEIVINDRCETSAHGIFAAGDCTTVPYKQIVIAMGEGSKAALSAFDHLIRSTSETEKAAPIAA
ncbi:MAG: alkyl hydroperoxide reductase subunit F [Pseudazoarcus pumilus]|nr:alkyl hydroperoxide reductase subunit F [Pseudazoarcus pumilus]